MAPNIHQFTRELEDATKEKAASRPVVIRWAVPIDDTHTWNMELAQVDPAWGLTPEQIGSAGFGQSDDRPYEERQRHPADYDAQSSQREIAVHALEHLASTDKGVIMFRKIVRDGIRVVPAELVANSTALKHLPGVLTLLDDAGYNDEEALRWLYTADDTLPGTPAVALDGGRATEVKRRAQALGF